MSPQTLPGAIRFEPHQQPPQRVFADAWSLFSRHRLILLGVPFLTAAAFATYGIIRPRTFTSGAAFMGASAEASAAGLANLASQFGVRIPTRDATQSPQFYADFLRSRQVQDSVVRTRYTYRDREGNARQESLVEALKTTGSTPALNVENAMLALDRLTTVGVGRETGVVRISVSTLSPELSTAIVRRYLELVNRFNLETRQTRAQSERRFTQERLNAMGAELRQSEERLRDFLRVNRSYATSPTLGIEYDRLSREVSMRQQVYTTLMQAYEQARIDEVRDTPVITTVEPPYVPVRADRRGLLRLALLGGVLGVLIAVAVALGREQMARRPLIAESRA